MHLCDRLRQQRSDQRRGQRGGADSGAPDVVGDAGAEVGVQGSADGGPETDAPNDTSPDASDGAIACGWTPYNTGLSGGIIVDVLFDTRTKPASLYATGGNSVFKSTDNGATWSTQGTSAGTINYLAAPADNANLLLASSSMGVIKSTNSGQTWSSLAFANLSVDAIAVAPSDPLRVYVGISGGGSTDPTTRA